MNRNPPAADYRTKDEGFKQTFKETPLPYFTTPDNCKLYYTSRHLKANRPAVVFLNGTSQTTIYWEPHAAAFAKQFSVLCYDARAQGKSDIGTRPISAKAHIKDLINLLEHLRVPRAHLVGTSHGAYVASMLAATTPEWVDRLVLCSIGSDSQAYIKHIVQAWLQILQRTDLETMAWAMLPLVFGKRFLNQNRNIVDKIVAAIATRNDKQALMAHFSAISAYPSVSAFASSIQRPTLLISGVDDPIVSPTEVRQLAKQCNGRHEIIPEAGHSVPAETPVLFQQVAMDFLNPP